MRHAKIDTDQSRPKRAPAKTLESREKQLISKAWDLVERRIDDGTASSQLLAEFIKRGSTRERLEKKRIEMENELTQAKIEDLKSQKNREELYLKALEAMSRYSGNRNEDTSPEDVEE
jgi:hypothetical protein